MATFNMAANQTYTVPDSSFSMKVYYDIHSTIQVLTSKYYGSLDLISQTEEKRWAVSFAIIAISLYAVSGTIAYSKAAKIPVIGKSFKLEPFLLSNFRFFLNAKTVLDDGYRQFKNTTFKFIRADAEMLVLPARYVDELRNLSNRIASPTVAHVHNLMGRHTNMDLILHNNLHFRTLQEKMTPNLGSLTTPMQDELAYAIDAEFPDDEVEWVSIKPYHVILRLVSRISARVFLGLPYCRNEEWLEISTQFTENVFVCLVVLRLFPMWMHGLLSLLMPAAWRGASYVKRSKKLLVPEIKRRQKLFRAGELDSKDDSNLLSWMIELAKEGEQKPSDLAHLEVVMSLASIHTSQMNAVHVLYDLATYPKYIEPIREEIKRIIAEDGSWMEWKKTSFSKLRLLDSFMKESQRWNPPSLLSYHRVMMGNHTLSDGFQLKAGNHICMTVNAIQNDPENTPSPENFDGFRYYKMRQRENEGHLHQFATTEATNLNFGHGKYACPGRFFAALEIKVILVRLLMDYDFKLADGKGRPKNLVAHEFIFPNPDANLLVKRRQIGDRL